MAAEYGADWHGGREAPQKEKDRVIQHNFESIVTGNILFGRTVLGINIFRRNVLEPRLSDVDLTDFMLKFLQADYRETYKGLLN